MISFNKYFLEETENPNIKIVKDEVGNITHYNDQGQLIYKKDSDGYEEKYNDQGKIIYIKHPFGLEVVNEYNDEGELIYSKNSDGQEIKYNDQGKIIYKKDSDGKENIYKYNDQGKLIYKKYSNGDEYKYNDEGELIYKKYLGNIEKYNDQGELIYLKYPNGKEIIVKQDEYGILSKEREIAIKKAENYMRDYHGMFIHTFDVKDLEKTLNIPENSEVCVSTVRSSSVFRKSEYAIIFIGFGNIRELYDFDAYSRMITKGSKKGSRRATADVKQSPALHDIKFSNLKTYHKEFNRNNYYDEGFMTLADADVLIASIPTDLNIYTLDKPETRENLIKQIKKVYPHIKIIKPQEFEKIRDSEDLLTLLYSTKQNRDDEELMAKPFNKYEEKFILFKDFFLL
jgi:YD repeat-containing protein